jgi:hypothetical protein
MYKGSTGAEHLVLGPEEKNVRALHHLNETHVRKKIIIIERKKERKSTYKTFTKLVLLLKLK